MLDVEGVMILDTGANSKLTDRECYWNYEMAQAEIAASSKRVVVDAAASARVVADSAAPSLEVGEAAATAGVGGKELWPLAGGVDHPVELWCDEQPDELEEWNAEWRTRQSAAWQAQARAGAASTWTADD